MWATNLKVLSVVLGTVTLYTLVANWIPQVESDVPEELTFTGAVTAGELTAAGDELYHGAGGCVACHGLGTRAPNLLTDEGGAGPIGARCGERVPGQDCKTYLHTSLVDPTAYVVEGYQPIMPDMRRTLSESQIWAIVAFLQSQGGDVTVEASDIGTGAPGTAAPAGAGARPDQAAAAAGGNGSPGGSGSPAGAGSAGAGAPASGQASPDDALALLRAQTCLACHALGGEGGPIAPRFDDVGTRLSADDIRRSILEPNADTASGFEAVVGTMPQDFGQRLTAAQLETLVRFLSAQRGG